jgi:hypothetical protein
MGLWATRAWWVILVGLTALPGPVAAGDIRGEAPEKASGRQDAAHQAMPAESDQAPQEEAAPARPQACLDGRDLGPIRVQLGAVEAVTRVGEEVPIPVRIKGVCGLAGFSFGVVMESRTAQLVRVEQTPFLAGKPPVDVEFVGLTPGAPRQTIAGLRARGTGGVDGIGTLARLVFRGMTEGATRIEIVRLKLFDADLNEMATNPVPIRLTVMPAKRRSAGGDRGGQPRP